MSGQGERMPPNRKRIEAIGRRLIRSHHHGTCRSKIRRRHLKLSHVEGKGASRNIQLVDRHGLGAGNSEARTEYDSE